jgi:hypothetical protein
VTSSPQAFFAFARERHSIYLKRMEGKPPPWTDDPILSSKRFTNVFRELDRTTLWFRDNIRDPLKADTFVVPATIIFRWFNRIETGELLAPFLREMAVGNLRQRLKTLATAEELIRERIPRGPWVTGSYMVCSGFNTGDKLAGMMRFSRMMLEWWHNGGLEGFFQVENTIRVQPRLNLQEAHTILLGLQGLAGFTAYEVVTDLRFTEAVRPTDVMLWAHAGPGATRGASRVMGHEFDHLSQHSTRDQAVLVEVMKELLKMSRKSDMWPLGWPRWEMRDVEHTLCEFDKYERVRREQGRAKNVFFPARACPLPGAAI